jgi:DNA-binding HxlR family transcriptional regulator
MSTRRGYGQFCPVAQAAEVVAERWVPLILRELISGSRRFNDIRKGVPLMSPSLLSQRLKALRDAGVVERRPTAAGSEKGSEYHLTRAGQELQPVIEMLGLWGYRWLERDIRRDELDPALLMWDIRRRVEPAELPADRRTVVEFDLAGAPIRQRRWWLVFERGDVDLCLKDPGYEVDLKVASPLRALVSVWLGRLDLGQALRSRTIQLEGASPLARSFSRWFSLSRFAQLGRSADGFPAIHG